MRRRNSYPRGRKLGAILVWSSLLGGLFVGCADPDPGEPPEPRIRAGSDSGGQGNNTAGKSNGMMGTEGGTEGDGGADGNGGGEGGTSGGGGTPTGGGMSGSGGMSSGAGMSGSGGMAGTASSGGAAGSGGVAGSGGAVGGAGVAGAAGSGGVAGAAGNGGVAGNGGTAGSGGAAGNGGGGTGGNGGSAGSSSAVCDDGTVEAGECEPSSTALCSNDCVPVSTQECVDCEQNGFCYEFSYACTDYALTPEDPALCYDVMECVLETDCGNGTNTLTSCFCGNLTTQQCQAAPNSGAGSPAGACAGIIREALGGPSTSNLEVLERYLKYQEYPGGAALARLNCVKGNPCQSACGLD